MKMVPPVEGVIEIAGDLHCKSQEAEKALLEYLSAEYDLNLTEYQHYYYASLKKSVGDEYVKCNYCGHYNDRLGCKCHGFTCKGCGKVIYRVYIHRSPIRLAFLDDEKHMYVHFLVHSYDDANQRLLVYANYQKPPDRWLSIPFDKVPAHLEKYKDSYEVVMEGKVRLLSFYYPATGNSRDDNCDKVKIAVSEVGHPPYKKVPKIPNPERYSDYEYVLDEKDRRQHYSEVALYKGEEVDKLPDNYCIYLTYKKAPLVHDDKMAQTLIYAIGMVADCGYYYQDGQQSFYDGHFDRMAAYIEHFTDLNVEKFRRFVRFADKSGPGFIHDLSMWVEQQTGVKQYIENKPNVWNAVLGVHKALRGDRLTSGEISALQCAFADKGVQQEYLEFMKFLADRNSGNP